ncbi:MAG: protein kinase [Clostridia bacterium]|nr:protein kinase [Clostridia bacterium]
MDLTGITVNNRYNLLEQLGEGGMGVVYKAYDNKSGNQVAIKLMKDKVTSTYIEDLIRFKREIEIVSDFSHFNIVKIFDIGEFDNRPYIVMELLQGESLYDLLQKGSRVGRENALEIIKQLADVLNYIHSNGIIHRDIKPGNIFLVKYSKTLTIKLLDFGLAQIMELREIKDCKEVAGTFGYMSPEAAGILNKKIDERSDLYSLGVILYHLLTGRRPFEGNDLSTLLHKQAAFVPVELRRVNSDIPHVLEEITMKLLIKDPDMRYQSARGLLYDIQRFIQGQRDFTIGEKDQKLKLTYHTSVVGREEEINKVKKAICEAELGKGRVFLIGGEAGIGKSRLVEEIKSYVYENKGIFLRARCLNHDNKTPYQPFKDAIDEYINLLNRMEKEAVQREIRRIKDVIGDLGEIVASLNPQIEGLLGENRKLVKLDPERESQRHLMVLTDFICSLVDRKTVCVLFIDDLQWCDMGSLNLLGEILNKISSTNLMIIGTYRDNEVDTKHGLEKIKSDCQAKGLPLENLKLMPLDRKGVNKLIGNILCVKEDKAIGLTEYILNNTNGNPFFIINLLRELVENNVLTWKDGCWQENWNRLKSMKFHSNILDIILRRIDNMTPEQIDLLSKAAIIGREFETDMLYRLTCLSSDKVVSYIDEFIYMQMVEVSEEKGRMLFTHDRIRDAFYYRLQEEEKRKIHLSVARVIEAMNRNCLNEVVFDLVHHYVEAGDVENALKYVIPAAEKARISYANEEAIKYYNTAMKLMCAHGMEGSSEWLKAKEELAEAYLVIGKNDEAIEILEYILSIITDSLRKASVYNKLGVAYFKKGNFAECEEKLGRGLEFLGEKIPRGKPQVVVGSIKELLRHITHSAFPRVFNYAGHREVNSCYKDIVMMYHTLVWMYAFSDVSKVVRNVLRALNITEAKLGKSKELGISLSGYSVLCATIPLFKRALKCQEYSLSIRKELNDEWGIAQCLQLMGVHYSWRGMHEESIKCLERSSDMFRKMGDMWEHAIVLHVLGYAYHYTSDYEKGIYYHNSYLEVSRKIKDTHGIIAAQIELSYCFIENGGYEKAEELLDKTIKLSKESDMLFSYCSAILYKGYLELEKGNVDNAISFLEEAREVDRKNAFMKDYIILLYPHLADAYVKRLSKQVAFIDNREYKSEFKKVRQFCKEALKKTKHWANHYGAALRVMANYYVLGGQYIKARQYFLMALKQTKTVNRRYELAKCYYEYGYALQLMGGINEAQLSWKNAYDIFEEIGAQAYIEKVRGLINYSGKEKNLTAEGMYNDPSTLYRLKNERRMSTVITTGRYISSILDLNELLEKIMDCAMELVGAERGILLLYPEEGKQELEIKVIRNVSKEEIEGKEFIASRSIISKIESDKTPLIISDALSHDELKTQSSVIITGIRSVMCAPIITRGEMSGAIYLDNSLLSGLFNVDDLNALDLICNQAGVSIENARLYTRLKHYSEEIIESRDEIAIWNQTLEQRVTERTEKLELLNNQLNMKNIELKAMNEQLKEYASTVEELAVARERNRMAIAVHDTLGHSMSILLKLLEAIKISLKKDTAKTEEKLSKAIEIAREGLIEVRRSVSGLMPGKLESTNLIGALEKLISDYQSSGVNVEFTVDGDFDLRNPRCSTAIYRTCQEALTNSLRHGKAKNVAIILKIVKSRLRLFIVDDGCGCKDISKGFGLSGMEHRIKELGGTITYKSDGENGFNIHVEIPLERW